MAKPAMAARSIEFGSLIISWVSPGTSAAGVRNVGAGAGAVRLYSGNALFTESPGAGVGLPTPKGTVLAGPITGAPAILVARPSASMTVPCGIDAIRAMLAVSSGAVVAGTRIQMPGSM